MESRLGQLQNLDSQLRRNEWIREEIISIIIIGFDQNTYKVKVKY